MNHTVKQTIHIVDDEDTIREFMCDALATEDWDVYASNSGDDAMSKIEQTSCDVLVTDIRLGGGCGIELARSVSRRYPHVAIIIITGFPEVNHVKHVDELEASFLTKPFTARQLRFSVLAALEKSRCRMRTDRIQVEEDFGIVGTSQHTVSLRREICRIGPGEFPVLISGPSGTGKELVAQAIHATSRRAGEPMITINCAAIPKHLEEAEFFGYTRGSFTGADVAKHGIIASAENSTLFLDEVGELSLDIQAKLLRVLDTGEYRRIGEPHARTAHVRIISATNRDVEKMISQGTFRKDLYFRLKAAVIETRPLSQRKEDIPSLVKAFIGRDAQGETKLGITADALSFLVQHQWEGNVRELKHTVTMLCHYARGMRRINMSVIGQVMNTAEHKPVDSMPYMEAKERLLKDFENDFFTRLVQQYEGNLNRAAKATGMHRPNLIKKLRTLRIDPDHFRPQSK